MTPESEVAHKKQEVNFVEWSKITVAADYDVERILMKIGGLAQERVDVLDVGGGIGALARILADSADNVFVDVVDNSPLARQQFIQHERLNLIYDNFLNLGLSVNLDAGLDVDLDLSVARQYDVIIFRTVLHHIIGDTSAETLRLQNEALERTSQLLKPDGKLFVIENFYDPLVFKDVTGELIFQCTKLRLLAPLFRSLGANTAGEGVRFRSLTRWMEMFTAHKFEMVGELLLEEWNVPLPMWQRLPFLCKAKYQALVELRKADIH